PQNAAADPAQSLRGQLCQSPASGSLKPECSKPIRLGPQATDQLHRASAHELRLLPEVGHSLIPSSRTRNSSGSKRSTKRVNIATIRANSSLPGQIRSLFVIRLATEASKHAAHSKAEPRASSKYLALWGPWRFPFPSAVLSRTDMDALSS